MIQEIKEYDSDTCLEIGIRIQDIRESRHMKAIELASYLGIGKNQIKTVFNAGASAYSILDVLQLEWSCLVSLRVQVYAANPQ